MIEVGIDQNGEFYMFCTECERVVEDVDHECEKSAGEYCPACGTYHAHSQAECAERQADWFARRWEQAELDNATMTAEELAQQRAEGHQYECAWSNRQLDDKVLG